MNTVELLNDNSYFPNEKIFNSNISAQINDSLDDHLI